MAALLCLFPAPSACREVPEPAAEAPVGVGGSDFPSSSNGHDTGPVSPSVTPRVMPELPYL